MPAPRNDLEQVVALRAAGEGVRAIARALGVAPSSISRIIRRPEIEERLRRERERLASNVRVGESSPPQCAKVDDPRASSPERPGTVWLLVKSGSWGFGSRRGEAVVMRSLPAGLYRDVDEEVVAFVRTADSPQLVLGTGGAARVRLASPSLSLSEDVALPPERDTYPPARRPRLVTARGGCRGGGDAPLHADRARSKSSRDRPAQA